MKNKSENTDQITIEKFDPATKEKSTQQTSKENWEANKHVFEKLGWKVKQ